MDLIKCSNCGNEISCDSSFCPKCGTDLKSQKLANDNLFCPNCGTPTEADNLFCPKCGKNLEIQAKQRPQTTSATAKKVTIIGYTESFAMNPSVSIYKQGVQIGEVSKGGQTVLDIDGPCELEFKCSFRSTKLKVEPDMHVLLSFNRTTGGLSAIPTTAENVMAKVIERQEQDNSRLVNTIVIVGILMLAGTLLKCVGNSMLENY